MSTVGTEVSAAYDPFVRGRFPVGVRSETWVDEERERSLDVEIWYPTTLQYQGQDLDPQTQDVFPAVWSDDEGVHQTAVRDASPAKVPDCSLVIFSHGYAGFRREATFVTTHLASHGFVVVAADHVGSTSWDIDEALADPDGDGRAVAAMATDRMGDIPFLISSALGRGLGQTSGGVGVTGISMGGWTTLIAPAVDPRVSAIVPMCPAGGRSPVSPGPNPLQAMRDLTWSADVETLQLVADQDSWLPLPGQLEIFSKIPGHPRCVVLLDADHNHFVDDIEMSHEWFRDFTLTLAKADEDSDTRWDSSPNRSVHSRN